MVPPDPLRLQPSDIARLEPAAFTDFANRVLQAEGDRNGLSPDRIQTTDQINVADLGIDARVNDEIGQSRWFFPGVQVFQYKSGGVTAAELKREFSKPGVQEVVKQGGGYIILAGRPYSDPQRQSRERTLEGLFRGAGLEPRFKFLTAPEIAQWAAEHPALSLLAYFGRPMGDLMRFEDWSALQEHRVPFQVDTNRGAVIRQVRDFLERQGGPMHIRLEGPAGVGKTRLGLECLRRPGLQERVLYAPEPEDLLRLGLLGWMRVNHWATLVLVVDECERVDADALARHAEGSGGRLRLVTIGPEEEARVAAPMPLFLIERLGEDELGRVVRSMVPGLHPEGVRFVLSMSGGYVKLATAIASALATDPGLMSARDLTKAYQVQSVLSALLRDETTRRGMRALALLDRVGMEGDMAVEGQALAVFVGISWADLQIVEGQMRARGLVMRRGRYRYVTPHLLTVWLAAETWDVRGRDVLDLVGKFPTQRGRRGILKRLADLGGHEYAQQVGKDLLSEQGLFSDISSMDDEARSEVLGMLASVSPEAALDTLQRLLGPLAPGELVKFSRGRRHVVWTLSKLAWLPHTFRGAAQLLLALAEAENEEFANNATGTWAGLFHTHLGGTAVPALERHRILEQIFRTEEHLRRKLAVLALEAALTIHEVRIGGAEDLGGRMAPPEWRPPSLEEHLEVRRSALRLLEWALADPEPAVQDAARQTFLRVKRNLILFGLGDDVVRLLEYLPLESDESRREVRVSAEELLRYESGRLSDTQRVRLEDLVHKLEGSTFEERLRRWVGPWSIHDMREGPSGHPIAAEEAMRLAEEGFSNPDLVRAELDWLASSEAENGVWFGRRLGELDVNKEWLEALLHQVRAGRGSALLAGYLMGQARAGRREWTEDLLDQLAAVEPSLAPSILEATWRGDTSPRGARRLASLVKKEALRPADLGLLIWGAWVKNLDIEAFELLLNAFMRDESPDATGVALTLLDTWLDEHPEAFARLAPRAWALIERPAGPLSTTIVQHHWAEVAKRYFGTDPVRLVRAVLAAYSRDRVLFHETDAPVQLLAEAARSDPKPVWEEVGTVLLQGGDPGLRLRLGLEGWYGELVGPDILLEWADQRGHEAHEIVAHLARTRGTPLPELARRLLIKYGNEEDVRSALYANVVSGGWSGPGSAHYQKLREEAETWVADPEPSVRAWAEEVVRGLEEHVEIHRKWEEESELTTT